MAGRGLGAVGASAERTAEKFLKKRGLKLLQRNYSCRQGEIDLIMQDGSQLVFVEVRYRRNSRYGSGAETVSIHKQRRIIQAARSFIGSLAEVPACRFDVVSITGEGHEITCLRNAFELA